MRKRIYYLLFFLLPLISFHGCNFFQVTQHESITQETEEDNSKPIIIWTNPDSNDSKIATNSIITATFSKPINISTIDSSTFLLLCDNRPVAGAITYDNDSRTAVFTPSSSIANDVNCTATLTSGITDATGNSMETDYQWEFSTGSEFDNVEPTVESTTPAGGAVNVALSETISVTFSEAMNPSTINAFSFTLSNGENQLAGTITYSDNTAIFTPSISLVKDTTYTVSISTEAEDLAGNALTGAYTWQFTTDNTPPTIASTNLANGIAGVAVNSSITATFSEDMDSSTITDATFTVSNGTSNVTGTVTYSSGTLTATFTPSVDLANSMTFTASISTETKDLAGNAIASAYTWQFTTIRETVPPTVVSTSPADAATNVATNLSTITATFSEAMDPATMIASTFTISGLSGTVTYSGDTATFTLSGAVSELTTYTATITTYAADASGNAMASPYSWTFTTGAAPDTTAPTVSSTTPASSASTIAVTSTVAVTFSEALDTSSINSSTFTVVKTSDSSPVSASSITTSGDTATFTPASSLADYTSYTVTLTTGVTDSSGNPLASAYTWTFTTAVSYSRQIQSIWDTNFYTTNGSDRTLCTANGTPAGCYRCTYCHNYPNGSSTSCRGTVPLESSDNFNEYLTKITSLTGATTGGSLTTATYYYRISTLYGTGQESIAAPRKSVTIGAGVTTGKVTVRWNAISGATGYKIYRGTSSTANTELLLTQTDTTTTTVNGYTTMELVDDGSYGSPSGALPSASSNGIKDSYDFMVNKENACTNKSSDGTTPPNGVKIVNPGDSTNSVLYQRIGGGGLRSGETWMPAQSTSQTYSLCAQDAASCNLIKQWIDEGAQNN